MKLYSIKDITVKKDGTTLDCIAFGTGSRVLLLIPGLNFQRVRGALLPLAYMYRMFAKEYTVYVIDRKEVVPDNCTIREMAADTAFVMERLNLRSADVFGVSQGGMIAQYLAIDYPHLVNRLVLAVTTSRTNETLEEVTGKWIEFAEQGRYEGIIDDMFKMHSAEYIKKYGWLFPAFSKIGKPKDFSRFIALARACKTFDAYSDLNKIRCPVFVIGGRRDHIVTGGASEEIAAALNCGIYMYDTLGHGAYDEAPDFKRRVYEFLTSDSADQ